MRRFLANEDKSQHNSFGRALDMKTQGSGFDSRAGQPNNY